MTTLSEVYAKFGESAEAAQLLETELGNMLLWLHIEEHDLRNKPDKSLGWRIFNDVDHKTLGQLIRALQAKAAVRYDLESLLRKALQERNRLNHAFYRQHNFRRNSAEGRTLMLQDLDQIHVAVLNAYKAILLVGGVDLDALQEKPLPMDHLPLNPEV